MPGMYPSPVDVCLGPIGKLFVVTDDNGTGYLLSLTLHCPVEVEVLKSLNQAQSVSYSNKICYVANSSSIMYFPINNNSVHLDPSKIKYKPTLKTELSHRGLNTDGVVKVLQERLASHLRDIKKSLKVELGIVVLDTPVKPATHTSWTNCEGVTRIAVADEITGNIFVLKVSLDGVTVYGEVLSTINTPTCVRGIVYSHNQMIISASGGIYSANIPEIDSCPDPEFTQLTANCNVTGISFFDEDHLVFCDRGSHQIKKISISQRHVEVIAGNSRRGYTDGTGTSCMLNMPSGICVEGETIFIAEPGCDKVRMIVGTEGIVECLGLIANVFGAYAIHKKHAPKPNITFQESLSKLNNAVETLECHVTGAQQLQKITRQTNGPEGTISSKTRSSIHRMSSEMQIIQSRLTDFKLPTPELSTFLSNRVENLHAVSHFKHQTFSTLTYCQDFGKIAKECQKREGNTGFTHYTHRNQSHYSIPEAGSSLLSFCIPKTPSTKESEISETRRQILRDWVEDLRPVAQTTVRMQTMKDKCGALPPAFYDNHVITRKKSTASQHTSTTTRTSSSPSADSSISTCTAPLAATSSPSEFVQIDEFDMESDSECSDYESESDSDDNGSSHQINSTSDTGNAIWQRMQITRSGRISKNTKVLDM